MASYQLSRSPTEGRDEETIQPSFGNKFANDGSFFEMFRRKMEDQQKAKDTQRQASAPVSESRTECRTDQSSQQEKGQKERTHAKPYQVLLLTRCDSPSSLVSRQPGRREKYLRPILLEGAINVASPSRVRGG